MRVRLFLPLTFSLVSSVVLMSTALPARAMEPKHDRYRDFVTGCVQAFDRSSNNGENDIGRKICECTAHESKHEGVTAAALERETAEIKRDPKHPIGDQRLLNALHYCSIQLIKGN